MVTSIVIFGILFLVQNTAAVPTFGGSYREGVVGQPVFINPALASGDVDKDVISLVYSNLYDISENITLEENKLAWTIRLKDKLLWHDGERLTSDDVIFTLKAIQDSESRSPLSITWEGVSAERISELEIKLTTSAPYAFFKDNVRELYIIPKHLFEDVPLANWRRSSFNLEPIGSGPYKYAEHEQEKNGFISSYTLIRNDEYSDQKPYIEKIEFLFFTSEEDLLQAFNNGRVDVLSDIDAKKLPLISRHHATYELHLPNYYAIFLNQSTNSLFKNKNVRLALNNAIPRNDLIQGVFDGHATIVSSPMPLSGVKKPDNKLVKKDNPEEDSQIISKSKITLVVPDLPFLMATGEIVKKSWEKLGAEIEIVALEPSVISSEVIRTRNYDALLFGNALARNPDILSFWHTNERFYPGLNLSLYSNPKVDAFLESIRQNFDESERQRDLISVQSLIIEDLPVIFLYSPNYIILTSTKVRGIDELIIANPSERFRNIESWYVKTKRVWGSGTNNQSPITNNKEGLAEEILPNKDQSQETSTSTATTSQDGS